MSTKRAPCPQCDRGPRDTALAITTDERGTVSYCHRCGYTSANNVVTLGTFTRAETPKKLDWSPRAEAIWSRTLPLAGSTGETYLRGRGCLLPPADGDLRFSPARDSYAPSLVARITDAITGAPLTLHFTPLLADGNNGSSRGERHLLAGHRKSGGVIRLWPNEAVTHGLAIAEGIETALAAAHVMSPMWATVDAGNLKAFPVLPVIESLTIFADHDDAGLTAARTCAACWRAGGREARVLKPRTPGEDVADIARRQATT